LSECKKVKREAKFRKRERGEEREKERE